MVTLALTVTLAAATLPPATVGQTYTYDFKPRAASNDPAFTSEQATFSASDLPSWLQLSNGEIFGTPATKNEAGTSFQVTASYKGQNGQQV